METKGNTTLLLSIILGVVCIAVIVAGLLFFRKIQIYNTSVNQKKFIDIEIVPTEQKPYKRYGCLFALSDLKITCGVGVVKENATVLVGGANKMSKISSSSAEIAVPTSSDLNGFPIYPGLKFIKKEIIGPCTGKESGFSICGSIAYTYTSNEADKVWNWYQSDLSKSGWKSTGGAGSYANDQNYNGKTTFEKGNIKYDINLMATDNNLEMILTIPNK